MNPNTEIQPENGNATMAWKQGSVANAPPPPPHKKKTKIWSTEKKNISQFFFEDVYIFPYKKKNHMGVFCSDR